MSICPCESLLAVIYFAIYSRYTCSFAHIQYSFPYIKSPMFVLNSLYDTAQLAGILKLPCLPPNCSDKDMMFFYNFEHVSPYFRVMIIVDVGS